MKQTKVFVMIISELIAGYCLISDDVQCSFALALTVFLVAINIIINVAFK